jgi:hypothetical protein
MARPTPEQLALIQRFEPILFFDSQERFFPSDAKRYVEHCALWKASKPFLTKADWGGTPAIATDQIAPDPVGPPGTTYLGRKDPSGQYDFLKTPLDKECFLEMGGWTLPTPDLSGDNRFANLDAIAARYANEPALKDSQIWYHAEFFDFTRLRVLFTHVRELDGNNLFGLLQSRAGESADFNFPSLICYYLFFPAHQEGLLGCDSTPGARDFASFAGDWACVSVLLDRPTAAGADAAKFIGLSNRNVGQIIHDGQEIPVGMRLLAWDKVPRLDDHAQVSVARGSHGLYAKGETPGTVMPFTPDDPSRLSCGLAEKPVAQVDPPTPDDSNVFGGIVEDAGIALGKLIGGALAGGAIGGPWGAIGGLVGGAVWLAGEDSNASDSLQVTYATPPSPAPPLPAAPVVDSVDAAGKVVHPKGKRPSDVPAGPNVVEWRSQDVLPDDPHSFIVDREREILFGGDPQFDGYSGRWGQRVEQDPQLRRSGIHFPNFWQMVFEERFRSEPHPPVLQPSTVLLHGTPIGNATQYGGLASAYDGN